MFELRATAFTASEIVATYHSCRLTRFWFTDRVCMENCSSGNYFDYTSCQSKSDPTTGDTNWEFEYKFIGDG